MRPWWEQKFKKKKKQRRKSSRERKQGTPLGGGGGFTQPIPGDGGADQLRGVPIIGRLPTDGTRGPEVRGYGRTWPDADGPVKGSQARDVNDSVV